MKKIMFNDQYGLTKAVLEGRKTQTRRIIHFPKGVNGINTMLLPDGNTISYFTKPGAPVAIIDGVYCHSFYKPCVPQYFIGETVAIAQRYRDSLLDTPLPMNVPIEDMIKSRGMRNKMCVKAELMPHHILITGIRLQQVCDVTDEEAMLEGIKFVNQTEAEQGIAPAVFAYGRKDEYEYETPRSAYLGLCCRLKLPQTAWVFVYDFELVD